jgi:UDP-N-acetylglucosamine--N-acetylmuramyl-(pentapeptide) pyrophosphoryl-undecaprenol N-acetylglucosamine transferase
MFSGGGTGGHVFPAIAVAERVREMEPEANILFLGTKNKIEAKVIPASGFSFKSIWITGFSRKSIKENLLFPIKLIVSTLQSIAISMKFKPQVIVATGGYVSGPAVLGARVMGAKVILIEPNSYPGITTRLLEKYAIEIHLMFEDARQYLRGKEKLFITGNPVRTMLKLDDNFTAREKFGLTKAKKVVFVLGGSLGAIKLNKAISNSIAKLAEEGIGLIWQTGSSSYEEFKKFNSDMVKVLPFIDKMNDAYSASDLVISRAGATTIAELSYIGKPAILVPFPFAAENHQLKNAMSMVKEGAGVLLEENELEEKLILEVIALLNSEERLNKLAENLNRIGGKDAAKKIAGRVVDVCNNRII